MLKLNTLLNIIKSNTHKSCLKPLAANYRVNINNNLNFNRKMSSETAGYVFVSKTPIPNYFKLIHSLESYYA
jgi:hypothetical protein